jgi:2-dehydro-3-deoxygluconokinase
MRSAGATVSFDVNHRASLWEGRGDEDVGQLREVAALTDVLFASGRDIARMLKLDPVENATAAVTQAFSAFRQLGVIASTRRSLDADGHRLSVRIDQREESHQTEEAPLGPVVDRIGSGDAFAGAVIDGLVRGASLEDCARQGLAAAVMKHGISGDRWIGTRQELDAFDPFAAGDIRR